MKLQILFFTGLFALATFVHADNRHVPDYTTKVAPKTAVKAVKMPNSCEIEIVNCSYDDLVASGPVEDGGWVFPFIIGGYSFFGGCERHLINLFDYRYRYCPSGMWLTITDRYGPIYDRFVSPPAIIRIK